MLGFQFVCMTCIFKKSQNEGDNKIIYKIEEFTFISTFLISIENPHQLLLGEIFVNRNELEIHSITTDCYEFICIERQAYCWYDLCTKTYSRMKWNTEKSLRFLSLNWMSILHFVLVLECAFIECNTTLNWYIDNGFSYHKMCAYFPVSPIFYLFLFLYIDALNRFNCFP